MGSSRPFGRVNGACPRTCALIGTEPVKKRRKKKMFWCQRCTLSKVQRAERKTRASADSKVLRDGVGGHRRAASNIIFSIRRGPLKRTTVPPPPIICSVAISAPRERTEAQRHLCTINLQRYHDRPSKVSRNDEGQVEDHNKRQARPKFQNTLSPPP